MKKRHKRFVSFLTATIMFSNLVPFDELLNLPIHFPKFSSFSNDSAITAHAIAADAFAYENGAITFNTASDFVDYCSYYADDSCYVDVVIDQENGQTESKRFAEAHMNDVLYLTFGSDSNRGEIPVGFIGLGNDDVPFNGEIHLPDNASGSFKISTYGAPLFTYVNDTVKILSGSINTTTNTYPEITVQFDRLSDVSNDANVPLFAQYVCDGTGTPANWNVELASTSTHTYSGVIGNISSGAVANLAFTNNSGANVASNADVGVICGIMQTGSTMNLSFSETSSAYSITSASGNAGGLVGTMNGTATLNISSIPSVSASKSVVSTSAYAGGLVGEITSQATISMASAIPVGGSVTGASGAGGLFGHYINYATEFDLASYNNTATVDGTYCGGVFGVLENNKDGSASSLSLTIKNTSDAGTLTVNSGTTGNANGYFGGIAGKYTTNALANSLIIDGLTLTTNANAAYSAFGGAIGIADSKSYLQTTNTVSVTATGTTSSTYFGGLVGATSADNGVFVDLGSFTLNTGNEQFKGGGVVGLFNKGVLRLSGTTTMTNAKPASAANCGQLVGNNDNVLVYAPSGGSWSFSRSSGAMTDDLGTWGEVVRGVDDSSSSNAIYFNNTAHTATVAAAETSMGSADDFIRTALNIQLNQGSNFDCLLFTSGSANTRATLLASTNLSLSADISLAGTGIMGFMRDGGTVADIGVFTGTFDGNDHTITLAIGEKYGSGVTSTSTAEGIGQIYRHRHNGLFSVLAGTVKELTVTGTVNVSNCVDGMNIGGIASRNGGNVTLTKVTANETVNYNEDTKITVTDEGKNIGGYIGYVGTNGNITIDGVSSIGATFNLSGSHEDWNVYGGAIGKISAAVFTVNIGTEGNTSHKLSNSLTTSMTGITAVGSNSDSGGLIGYITNEGSYTTRIVNIYNLEFNNCTIGNAASSTGGGFLGYSWLNTTTTIDGLTVKGTSSINNIAGTNVATTPSIGVMCYDATGKWNVNSLTITAMSMNNGGGTSLGILVNKAYHTVSSTTSGLYLNVLKNGYTLTNSGISLPNSISIFDELAAYSASDVIAGGGGVVSINMNSSRSGTEAKITVNGTYQNQISRSAGTGITAINATKYANAKSRYYYNLDVMSNADYGQNLVLWSVSKYASSNIADEFIQGEGESFGTTIAADSQGTLTFSGTANLTGLSFYPLKKADDYTIDDLALTFDYNGIYSIAETVSNGDSYIRDPGAANQHYLMHSGLFMNLPTGKTLTVTGDLSLAGTFLGLNGTSGGTTNSANGYSGVIISRIMNGNFICEDGSIELAGITPKSTGDGTNVTAYTGGYLLINNIVRESDTVSAPQLIINNLYTGSGYTGTLPVASSLVGNATGNDLTIKFSHVKLDARTTALSGNSGLNTAYNTSRSIFNDAVFLHSIKTNQTAILEYYYTYAEDWEDSDDADSVADRYVTYGKEVKDSLEYRENGVSLENCYSGSNRAYTNPVSGTDGVYDFSSGWLRYVYTSFEAVDENAPYYRELKVNVEKNGPQTGCGTYNHPYVISGSDLSVVAKFISAGSVTDMQKIRLPKTEINGVTNNAKGDRWCSSKTECALFELATSGDNNGKYVYTDTSTSPATVYTWTSDNVRLYLTSAYYKINSNITLDSNFVGLGCTTVANGNYAFRGVIVGEKTSSSNTAPKWTITNNSSYPLINVSNGSVVKDISVNVDAGTITRSQSTYAYNSAYFGYNSQCQYYGGIIGEIMGGDNIVDNSYVVYSYTDTDGDETDDSFSTTIQLTDNGTSKYGTIIPVGGYVGVVVYGGLIFKNMTASKTTVANTGLNVNYKTNTTNLARDSAEEAIYVNPIVGRVINGYAVNETSNRFSVTEDGTYHDDANSGAGTANRSGNVHTLKNGKKHYSIADIQKYATVTTNNSLSITPPTSATADGTINVPNAQALFILSLITQSGAGTATTANSNAYVNSLSYGINTTVYGMSHVADYNNIGTAETDKTKVNDFIKFATYDTAANTAIPYIIMHYTYGTGEEVSKEEEYPKYTGDLNGKVLYISNTRSEDSHTGYLIAAQETGVPSNQLGSRTCVLQSGTVNSATKIHFNKVLVGENYYYTLSFIDVNDSNKTKYLKVKWIKNTGNSTTGNLEIVDSIQAGCYFDPYLKDGQWRLKAIDDTGKTEYISQSRKKPSSVTYYFYNAYGTEDDNGAKIDLCETTPIPATKTFTYSYPARFVTTSTGSYDITLANASYILPDSFRGLGCVGKTDAAYCMKVDQFTGGGSSCAIDEDIYLNKYQYDNYFNYLHSGTSQTLSSDSGKYDVTGASSNHGIGLFDSIKTKNASSLITNFKVSGSVNTEIFSNDYDAGTKELTLPNDDTSKFLSVSGVCGYSPNSTSVNFSLISLNNLSISGSCIVGGLLGYSGNDKSVTNAISIVQCDATNLSVKMTSSSTITDAIAARNAIGGFVGKCYEGKVDITGNTSGFSIVSLSAFEFESADAEYRAAAGGLVGFAGDGCTASNMKIKSSSSNSPITIGGGGIRFAGGICGAMQSKNTGANDDGTLKDNYTPTCEAEFTNCIVEDINFKGEFVGGFYGGKWGTTGYTTYSITIDNCQVIGTTNTQNTIQAVNVSADPEYAGGFIGRGLVLTNGDPNIEIIDSKVSNYNITGTYCGGFLGYAGSFTNDSSITCYIHDSYVENSNIGTSDNYAGGIIGHIDRKSSASHNKILGYNIKLDNVISNSSIKGAWIGYVNDEGDITGKDDTTAIQLSGMAVYVDDVKGFTQNVGNRSDFSNANFVFADYTGKSKTSSNNAISSFNSANNVFSTPKSPYVNINPHSGLGGNEIISGDGAVLYGSTISGYSGKTADMTMAAKIYYDSKQTSTNAQNYYRRYSTFVDSNIPTRDDNTGVSIENYMKCTANDGGDRISTYATERGSLPDGLTSQDNFAVIVIANTDNIETTNLINRYIQLVTNTSTDYTASSDFYNIVIRTCEYDDDDDQFKIITDSSNPNYATGLTFTNGTFALSGANADSGSGRDNTFTLIDVQFTDPFDSDHTDIAYHLYVPVFTIKQMTYGFSAAALTDTNSVSYSNPSTDSDYETAMASNNRLLVDNVETWVTQYIRFSYSSEDINNLLLNGDVKWNYNKYVTFDTQQASYKLPDNTYLVLVDPNGNSDKVYYASADDFDSIISTEYGGWKVDLADFKNGNIPFSVSSFNQMIAKDITATPNSESGLYTEITFAADHTITDSDYIVYRIDGNVKHYYVYATGESTNRCDLSVPNDYVLNEDYYISMFVPEDEAHPERLYFYTINSPSLLTATGGKKAARSSNSTYNVLISDLYSQITSYTVDPPEETITESNNAIAVNASTTITLRNTNAIQYLRGRTLYHAFDVLLNSHGEDGNVGNEIAGLDNDDITATYTLNSGISNNCQTNLEKTYLLVKTANIMPDLLNADNNVLTISADIEMEFNDITAEFPEKSTSAPGIGVNVTATSNLAYDIERLAYSSMSEPIEGDLKYYYRDSIKISKLFYTAVSQLDEYDTSGKDSKNYSRLGVNGQTSERTAMQINSKATLDASVLEDATNAKARKIRFTMTLNKKTDTTQISNGKKTITKSEYAKVGIISNYLSDIDFKVDGTTLTKLNSSTADIYIFEGAITPSSNKEYTALIEYSVKTGSGFTEYANYQVVLEAELLDADGETIGNKPSDYLVYTNAKIYPTVIEAS